MIRALLTSYDDISTSTLSPGTMRMKFFRIFPLMCASTFCPFGRLTRNIVLGRTSVTTPSVMSGASFGIGPNLPDDPALLNSLEGGWLPFPVLFNQAGKAVKKISRIVGTWSSLRMVLYAENRICAVPQTFHRAIIEVDVRDLHVAR